MGIWKINIERNYCVIAYAMPTHSVHSPIPFKGIPEPPLEVACLHASFFDGLRSGIKTEFMPKVQAVTAMTLDGFLPETDNVLMRWVMNHRKGFARWRERCDARILPHYILDLLCEKDTKGDSFIYLAEVSDAETLDLLRGLFHYNLVEELNYLPFSLFRRQREFHTGHLSRPAMAVTQGRCPAWWHLPSDLS